MKMLSTFVAAGALAFGAQAAIATTYSPTGAHTFSGPVQVAKDGLTYNCTLTVNVNASTSSATATASLSGGFPCGLISVTGTGTVTYDGTHVTISGLTIDPPISSGVCTGPIKAVWGGGTVPRTIALSIPLSNSSATSGQPCRMAGTLSQTSGGPLTITNP